MTGLSIPTKKIYFRIFLSILWLIPVLVIFDWNPCFPLTFKAIEAAQLFKNQGQRQLPTKDSQINPQGLSVKDFWPEDIVIDHVPEGLLWKSRLKANLVGKSKAEIDIFRNKSSEIKSSFFLSGIGASGSDDQLKIIRLEQKLNLFDYGIEYRFVGKNLANANAYKKKTETSTKTKFKSDQEGVEVWGIKKIGPVGLKSFFSKFYDNVDRDPNQTRKLTNEYGIEMKYEMHSLPIYCALSYSRQNSESTTAFDRSKNLKKQKETYRGSLNYNVGKAFNIKAVSIFTPSQDHVAKNKITQSLWHKISTTIRPLPNLFITPAMSYREKRYLWYGERTENPSASLSVSCSQLFDVVDLALRGEYSRSRKTDGLKDVGSLNTSVGIDWDAKYLFFPKARFSWCFEYDQYDDEIYKSSSHDSFLTSLKLKFQI